MPPDAPMRKVTLEIDESVASALFLFLRFILDLGPKAAIESPIGPHLRTIMLTDPDVGSKIQELQEQLRGEVIEFAVGQIRSRGGNGI